MEIIKSEAGKTPFNENKIISKCKEYCKNLTEDLVEEKGFAKTFDETIEKV